jgi:chaperonin cofactor prefoldin
MTQPMILTVIIQSIIFAVGLFKIYTDVQVKLSELEIRLKSVEKQDDEIYAKLDKIMDKLTQIEINLNNKADRS